MTRFLFRIGFLNGRSLDRILNALTRIDKQLEQYEATQIAKQQKLYEQRLKINNEMSAVEEQTQRAARVRSKVSALVA